MTTHEPPPEERKPDPAKAMIGFGILLTGMVLIFWNSGLLRFQLQPELISTAGKSQDALFYMILWITGITFFITFGLLCYFLVRYRARPGGKALHQHGNHKLELAWTFVPGLILFLLAIWQTGVWAEIKYAKNFPQPPEAEVVQVIGKQFEWHFRYPGKDGEFGTEDDLTTLAELHIPVNTKILCRMRSIDTLHSFWIPNARAKQDIQPNMTIPLWFDSTKLGNWQISCAEYCGVGHTKMAGTLIVHTEADYKAWQEKHLEDFGPHDPELHKVWKNWR